jgi:antitoxin (DNA-binding transcriptional repressor) of toxin-antitoxin stability system
MKSTISLKQLRTDPRAFVDLLNRGQEVIITEHRRPLARAKSPKPAKKPTPGSAADLLDYLNSRPPVKTPFPEEDTVALVKRTKLDYLERKYGYRK